MFVRSAYNYDTDLASYESGLDCVEPSMTQQSFKDECDINTILERFNVSGQVPVSPIDPQYGDFSGVTDYQSALNAVIAAQAGFDSLPARVRERFANDPAAFVDFCLDESNREEMIQLGLVIERAVEAAQESPKAAE
jgi:phage internal scaffolding protein